MLINIAFVCVFFFEMLISTIFFSSIADKKCPLYKIIILGTSLFEIGAIINIFIISTVWLNVLISILLNFVFTLSCFKIKKFGVLFYSILLVAISTFVELTTIFIISACSRLYITEYESQHILLVIEVTISKIIYFLLTMFLQRFSRNNTTTNKIPLSFYIFPLITLISVVAFWYISLNQYLEFVNQIILGIVSISLLFSTLFIFFLFQANVQKESQLLLLQQEQDKIETDIVYYNILEQQNKNLRTYAHDTKNHLSAIKNLNNNPEIERHISKMIESLATYSKVCHSGNRTLDVVIDKYVTECELDNISFEFDIKNNNLSQIEPYDLVAVFGNLLDNALEAAKVSKERNVSIETDFRNNFSVIIVSNSCNHTPLLNDIRLPITTKKNKRLHGFGLKSVKKTIKKYDGDIAFKYNYEEKIFIVTLML